ncbi:MAG: hypothetical protein JNL90_20285 [Planctomycetes bacterium]|nr:hypothetical protein [Planctomycetota bacterium]
MLLAAALAPLLFVVDVPERSQRADRPIVLQRHSLAAFLETVPLPSTTFPLLPLSGRGDDLELDPPSGEPAAAHDADTLIDLLRTVVEPTQWDNDGWLLHHDDGGSLLIGAPSDVQAKIAELLATLERDLLPSERLELRVLPGRAASDGALLVDRATADGRLAAQGALHTARVALRDLLPVATETGVRHEYVSLWEVDVANAATSSTPERSDWLAGVRLSARATRVEAGALVQLAVATADAVGEAESFTFEAETTHRLEPALAKQRAIGRIDAPRVGFVSFAGTLLLPEGKVLWLPVTARSAWGTVECTLELRCELGNGRVLTVIEPIARQGGEALRFWMHRPLPEALAPLQFWRIATGRIFQGDESPLGAHLSGPASVARFGEFGDLERAREMAARAAGDVVDSDPDCHVALTGSLVRALLPPAASDRAARALEMASVTPRGAVVRGRVRRGEQLCTEFALPLLIGQPAAFWSGVQSRLVRGFGPEIAERVATPRAQMENFVDGIGLRLELQRSARGELRLGVNAAAQLLTAQPKLVPLGDASSLATHLPTSAVLAIDEWVTLPARGGSVTLGGDVTLELEVIAN